ncbi:hypothetical protein ACFQ6Q_00260 [Streptomyces sp. NPDC056437]|uniref:hypothetical protein n=1 Tax=Streptomyces sp. NPDC056437 TaxID=3345816 RepID=UPI0036BDF67C
MSKQQQAWHLDPDRVQRSVTTFCGSGTSVKLTARTAYLRYSFRGSVVGTMPDQLQDRFGDILCALYFDVRRLGTFGPYQLPRPVRMTITEQAADDKQTPPSDGDRMT